ncbi:MAG TPA: DNA-processing protein DprA [Fimbriimonadaceae bacterium]|nr:DNA-processing protein DprA [Fimbriimonadaceae bacterium]
MNLGFWQLLLAAEVSPAKGRALIEALGPSGLSDPAKFAASPLLAKAEAARVRASDPAAPARAGVELLEGSGRPPLVASLTDAAIAIFTLGETGCLFEPCVAIVGTRNATAYGKAVARRFAGAFASAGATVVSGGALGIDAAAHEAALAEGGCTAAVLACGLDKPYPSRNLGLFRRMRERGCQVSSYACGMIAERHKFVERNELIAALSLAVVVVEAPENSGALTTAMAARRFGRPVFVVPANIEATSFRGSHKLIRTGDTLVEDPDQVLAALGLSSRAPAVRAEPASALAAKILGALTTTPMPAEKLAETVRVEPHELLAELTMLELDGRVLRDTGGYALIP